MNEIIGVAIPILFAFAVVFYMQHNKIAALKAELKFYKICKKVDDFLEEKPGNFSVYDLRVARMLPVTLYNTLYLTNYSSLSEIPPDDREKFCRVLKYMDCNQIVLSLLDADEETKQVFWHCMSERAGEHIREEIEYTPRSFLSEEEAQAISQESEEKLIRELEEIKNSQD